MYRTNLAAPLLTLVMLTALTGLAGCAIGINHFQEDGPATMTPWVSPTVVDVRNRFEASPPRDRGWQQHVVKLESGVVHHYPLYFEDPFVDKAGRTDASSSRNKYHLGWEDFVAFPYCYSRFTLNWLMLPVSAVVTPPCTIMESDGYLSRQVLGYDHDATPAPGEWTLIQPPDDGPGTAGPAPDSP
jgi:hypothetical protein